MRLMVHQLLKKEISIHAPRVGCDLSVNVLRINLVDFNPRTPCGVRLFLNFDFQCTSDYFNPRTPCGVRHAELAKVGEHFPRFQSTHPVWGATLAFHRFHLALLISIHAPRVGCDAPGWADYPTLLNFNPRTPCGVRPKHPHTHWKYSLFQSTHPVWGATLICVIGFIRIAISIHAPRVGCDSYIGQATWTSSYISIHAPRVGCDVCVCVCVCVCV